jgi:hypothetical protein
MRDFWQASLLVLVVAVALGFILWMCDGFKRFWNHEPICSDCKYRSYEDREERCFYGRKKIPDGRNYYVYGWKRWDKDGQLPRCIDLNSHGECQHFFRRF